MAPASLAVLALATSGFSHNMPTPQIWNGTSWVAATKPKFSYWNGSTWAVPSDVKVWNGATWETIFPVAGTITLRATASANQNAANSIATTVPASVQPGDLLVLIVAQTSNATTLFNAISGWTKQGEQRAGGAAHTIGVFTRVAQAGDASVTVTSTSVNTENLTAHIRAYAGVNQTTPLDTSVAFAQQDPAATTASSPAVTTVTNNAMVITAYTVPTTVNTTLAASDWTDPTGFANEVASCTSNTTNNAALATYNAVATTAGAQGPFSATVTQSRRWAMATIALRPA